MEQKETSVRSDNKRSIILRKLAMFCVAFLVCILATASSSWLSSKKVIAVGGIPHSWLFKNAKCVIHHCGFGTTAATMIYGVPSIPVPHVLDQLGFAMQLEKKDVATKHIKAKDLSEQTIIAAIEELNSTYAVKKRNAEAISSKIASENGVNEAVRLISSVIEEK